MIASRPLSIALLGLSLVLSGCQSKEERAAAYVASGDEYMAAQNFTSARIEYSNALQLDQHNLAALEGMSKLYEQEEQLPELYKVLTTILQLDEGNIEARRRLVSLLAYAGDVEKALEQSQTLLQHAPERVDVQVVHAGLLFRTGQKQQAIDQAEDALKVDPYNAQARFLLASQQLSEGNYDQALDVLAPALEHRPHDRMLNGLKIRLLNDAGRVEEAIAVFKTLVDHAPADAALHKSLAGQYLAAGEPQKAEALLSSFAEREKTAEANLTLVEYLLAQKDLVSAETKLQTFIRNFPAQSQLQFMLADIYLASDRAEQANALLSNLAENAGSATDRLRAKNALAAQAQDSSRQAELYRQVLAEDPQNVTAIVGLAMQDLQQRNAEKAVRDLRAALSFAPSAPELHLALGQAHELQNDKGLAQDYYANALKIAGPQERYVGEYARFLMKTGEQDFAEEILQKAVDSGGAGRRTLSLLAQAKLNAGKWEEAQHYADQLETAGADNALVNRIRGAASTGLKQYDESIAFFQQAQKSTPDQFRPMASLVGAYLRAGKRGEAESFLAATLRDQPNNVHAQVLKGVVYEHHNEFRSAEAAYRGALKTDPKLKEIYRRLSHIHVMQNELPEALKVVQGAQRALGEDTDFAISEALLLQQMGEVDQATARYREILAKNPESDVAHNNLASLLINGNDEQKQEALKIAERFRTSEVPHFQDTLGWIYLQTGNKIEGLYLLEKAAERLNDHAEVRYHLGMAYLANERKPEAQRELEYAVEKSGQDFADIEKAKAALAGLRG